MSQRARHRRQPVTSGQTAAPRSDVHPRHVAVAGLTGPDHRRPPDASVTPRRLRPRPIPSRRPLLLPVAVAPGGGDAIDATCLLPGLQLEGAAAMDMCG